MYCVKCGAQNEDNTKFCTSCGASLEETAAEEVATDEVVTDEVVTEEVTAEEVAAEETVAEETVAEEVYEIPAEQMPEVNKKSGLVKKIIIGVVALVALVGIIFGCKLLFGGSKQDEYSNEKHPVMYAKDEDVYYLNVGSKKPYKLTDEYAGEYEITEDGKRIFFADDEKNGEYKLYYRVASQKTPKGKNADDKGIKIASGVTDFTISSKGDFVLYKKGSKLCISDLKEERTCGKLLSF